MNRLHSRSLLGVAFCLIAVLPGIAVPAATDRIGRLLATSTATVVGTVRNESSSGNIVFLTIDVLRSPKGSVVPGTNITIACLDPSGTPVSVGGLIGTTGIWFLAADASGAAWHMLPLIGGALPVERQLLKVPPMEPAGLDRAATPEDKLAVEIIAALQSHVTSGGIARLVFDGSLDDLNSPRLDASWAQLASSADSMTSEIALGAAIRRQSLAALSRVASLPPDTPPGRNLSGAVCAYRQPDEVSVSTLGALSQPPFPDALRACAAYALRNIHTRSAVPFFEILLDDGNQDARYSAVTGLAAYAARLPVQAVSDPPGGPRPSPYADSDVTANDYQKHMPSSALFAANEELWISYWKLWVAGHSTH